MKTSDFAFDLPSSLIAKYPTESRDASRLLHLNGRNGEVVHRQFKEMLALVEPGDMLVFNDTRVIPARLHGQKSTGGKIEVLIERLLDNNLVLAHVKASKAPKAGATLLLEGGLSVEMVGRRDALFELQFPPGDDVFQLLEQYGHMPLPPYIDRPDDDSDKERYQTVYNNKPGAVAAPTAGLHFTDDLLQQLKDKGVGIHFVTLHVGAGTFQPVKVDNVEEHVMHSEYAQVPESVVQAVKQTKANGKRVIAVGTTSMRSLETAGKAADSSGELIVPYFDDTDIFIYPGFEFKICDAMFTNFHLPESTLMMLISAFATQDYVMAAYQEAIKKEYRFFSYGDSMFIEKA